MFSFFVVPRNRQPLLGMPDIETQGILTINCNTIELQEDNDLENCKANTRQNIKATEKQYTDTDGSKFKILDKIMVSDNNSNSIKYFLQGPNSDANKKASDEIKQQLQRELKHIFNGIWYFDGTLSLQAKPDSKPYQVPPRCIVHAL